MKAITRAFLFMGCLVFAAAAQAGDGWQRFVFPKDAAYQDRFGNDLFPSCSGAPVVTLGPGGFGLEAADTQYSFFYREGNPSKLAIFFDGGGACWDELTCIGSAIVGDPIYDTVVDETVAELDATQGLADNDNPANPIAGYFQVFIPYCTGDLHVGLRNTEYSYSGPFWPLPIENWVIHHRGRDNVAAVLDWLVRYYDGKAPPRVAFIAGASAGGYGAAFHYPGIDDLLPGWTKKRVFSDSANGIINQDFYDRALSPGGVWGIWDDMPPELANAFASGPDALPIALNQGLAWNFPATRFGQYTRAFDAVQIFYLNVAKYLDSPELWQDPVLLLFTGLEWTAKARTSMLLSALTTFNYRYYLAQGAAHTTVADNSVYAEMSGSGILLTDWLYDMINRRWLFGSDWKNATCAPNCVP